jgi:hypothetical protein
MSFAEKGLDRSAFSAVAGRPEALIFGRIAIPRDHHQSVFIVDSTVIRPIFWHQTRIP